MMVTIKHCYSELNFERKVSLEEAMLFPIFKEYGYSDTGDYYLPYSFNIEYFEPCLLYFKGYILNENILKKDIEYLSELLKCVDCVGGDIKPIGVEIVKILKKTKREPSKLEKSPIECFKLIQMYQTRTIDYEFLESFEKRQDRGVLVDYLPLHLRARILFECC